MILQDEEYKYCVALVESRGDALVGKDPKSIATYLRLQAATYFRIEQWETAARLGRAATFINEDARNSHEPHWNFALKVLRP